MKKPTLVIVLLLFTLALTAGTTAAQPAPFNAAGVTMGHWHIISKDVEANKKLFLAMGGKLFMPGGNPLIMFPGLYINLNLADEKGDGGTVGSVVNHVGFIVDNVQRRTAQWKAAGVKVLPGNDNRQDQAFVETPDGVRIEILEDKTQSMPIRNEHVHFFLPASEVSKAQAWYVKTFGGKPGTRNDDAVVDLPGVQLRLRKTDVKQAPTRHRVLDHIGFDVKDHAAFVKKIQAEGIKLDEPVRTTANGNTLTYITDPWGTRIEIIQRGPLGPEAQQSAANSNPSGAMPPESIPTFSTENLGRMAHFYAGGHYVGTPGKEQMDGAMYVELWVPKQIRQPYPIVMFHGNGQTGAVWQQTPDGRPGWAYYLIDQGYVVYMVDYPARGRSPYVPGVDGNLGIRTALDLEQIWTAPATSGGEFPRKNKYTQWPSDSPEKGMVGDPVFDNFIKGQMQFVNNQADLAVPAGIALLDKIGKPVILLTHSQGGGIGFDVAEKRPQFIAGMVSIEPGGPQIGSVDTAKVAYTGTNPKSWGLTTTPMEFDPPVKSPSDLKVHLEASERPGDEVGCYLQDEPAHKLVHFQNMRILSISAEGTYHRVFDACIPKWLNQTGAKDDFVRLEDVGIHGNMHEMFLDRNSDEVIKFIDGWLRKNINKPDKFE